MLAGPALFGNNALIGLRAFFRERFMRVQFFFVAIGGDFVRRRYWRPAAIDFLPAAGMALTYDGLQLKVKEPGRWDGDQEILFCPVEADDKQRIISGVDAGALPPWQAEEA